MRNNFFTYHAIVFYSDYKSNNGIGDQKKLLSLKKITYGINVSSLINVTL